MSVKHLYLVAVAAILGCAANGASTSSTHRTGSLLTAEEIAAAHADLTTAYDVIARLRPTWLAARGPSATATVFVDGQKYGDGDISQLRSIQGFSIASIRYYDVTQSTAMFGVQGGSAGTIAITMKTR